jgi:hypothetical protein
MENKAAELQTWIDENDYVQFGYRPERLKQEQADHIESQAETIRFYTHPREWVGLMRGVRVDGDTVIIKVKNNEEARILSDYLINEMDICKEKNA